MRNREGAACVSLASGGELRIAVDRVEVLSERAILDVLEGTGQSIRSPLDDQVLVDWKRRESRALAAGKPKNPLRPCPTESQALAEIDHRSPQPVSVGAVIASDGLRDLAGERWCRALIGVDRQNPLSRRQLERCLLLPAEVIEWTYRDSCAMLLRDRDRCVGRPVIEHDDLIGDVPYARETRLEARFFVVNDDDDRQKGGHVSPTGVRIRAAGRDFVGRQNRTRLEIETPYERSLAHPPRQSRQRRRSRIRVGAHARLA